MAVRTKYDTRMHKFSKYVKILQEIVYLLLKTIKAQCIAFTVNAWFHGRFISAIEMRKTSREMN